MGFPKEHRFEIFTSTLSGIAKRKVDVKTLYKLEGLHFQYRGTFACHINMYIAKESEIHYSWQCNMIWLEARGSFNR
jgi:hypothetical protein